MVTCVHTSLVRISHVTPPTMEDLETLEVRELETLDEWQE